MRRTICTCALALLLWYIPAVAAEEEEGIAAAVERGPASSGPAAGSPPQKRFERVWYRTPDERGKIMAFLASGDLTLSGESISFEAKKLHLTIPSSAVKNVLMTQFPDDPVNVWVAVEYEEQGARRAAAFKDAGLGRGTAEIEHAVKSIWLTGAPLLPSPLDEGQLAAALAELHTKRLEAYEYDNNTVPKNIWRLVFAPGIDDALVKAYRAGDADDLYRFNLVMILSRRAAVLEEEDRRQRVRDCLTEALENDGFDWVRGEALDGLKRLAGKREETEALGLVLDRESDAEARLRLLTWYAGWKKVPALYVAASMGRNDVVAALLDKGAAIEETAGSAGPGWTALMIAAAGGREATVKLLLDAGANPNAANDLGRTALMFASAYGFTPIVVDLLARGADPNAAPDDDTGWTALIAASNKGHVETVEALLKGGANPALKDKKGLTARDHAKEEGHSKVAGLLPKS